MIFRYAFKPDAIVGGAFGMALKTAISQGAKRGLFSNEAGMGSTPHAHAQANVAQTAFGAFMGQKLGAAFVAVCLFFFAFSTILSWNLFGKINVVYIFGKKGVLPYMLISLVFIFLGTMVSSDLVWELTDTANYLMVLPNVIGLIGCTSLVVSLLPKKK